MTVRYYEGERIYFRPIEPTDEPDLRRWVNDPRNWSTLSFRPPINAVGERRWIDSLGDPDASRIVFGVVERESGRMIGTAGLNAIQPQARRATFGLMIGEVDRQNRGYGSEATALTLRFGFEELNLNRIELSVFDYNPCGVRCYEKAGFVFEGRLRQRVYRHGAYHDELRYAVLRDEWFASRGGDARPTVQSRPTAPSGARASGGA